MSKSISPKGQIKTGWYTGLNMETYLKVPAMSGSGLADIGRSPAHYRQKRDHPPPATDAQQEGEALHMFLLEPELFEQTYLVLGQCAGRYKSGEKTGAQCEHPGKFRREDGHDYCGKHDPQKGAPMPAGVEVVTQEAMDRFKGMRDAVMSVPEVAALFRGQGRSEVTGIWEDEATGVLCKLRMDRSVKRVDAHFDLKVCDDARPKAFRRTMERFQYPMRCRFYRRGMATLGKPSNGSVLVAIERQPPHGVWAHLLKDSDLEAFDPEIDRRLALYRDCKETGEWPAYPTGLHPISLKPWELPGDDEDEEDDEAETEEPEAAEVA